MSDIVERLRCFNPLTGRRDGDYCVWEGYGKCLDCEAADEIERLQGACDLYRKNQIADLKRLAEAERLLRVVIGKWPDPVVDMHAKEIVAFLADRETEGDTE